MCLDFHEPISALSHGLWAILTPFASYYLIKDVPVRDFSIKLVLTIFILCTFLCYSSSFMYHAVCKEGKQFFQLCDHLCIFLMMAGTYTPIAYKFCRCRFSIMWVWGLALTGICLRVITGKDSEFVYIGIGWAIFLGNTPLVKMALRKDFLLLIAAGLVYTIGGILEYLQWPTIITGWVGPHEVFHLFVMTGTSLTYIFMKKEIVNDRSTESYQLQPN
jgi:hemolysin III